MSRRSKRFRKIESLYDPKDRYSFSDAIDLLKRAPSVKFDASMEVSIKLGVDPRRSDQHVRGTVSLPNGTGKKTRILVFAKGEAIQQALDAGADFAGSEDFVEKVAKGWIEFDAVVATPEMMRDVGKLGKILGPRGLMPTPKAGTVTNDVATAVKELKGGKIEFKIDKRGAINNAVGKLSFESNQLLENVETFIAAIWRAKPAAAKGHYLKSLVLSSTMGPGIKIDMRELEAKI